jgi:hypothetical protein
MGGTRSRIGAGSNPKTAAAAADETTATDEVAASTVTALRATTQKL